MEEPGAEVRKGARAGFFLPGAPCLWLACEIAQCGPGGFGSDCLRQDMVFPPQGRVA